MAHSQTVVVTGVSTGIGRACAEALITAGMTVFGSVRGQADADRLSLALNASRPGAFIPLIFDVTDEAGAAAAATTVRAHLAGHRLTGLVNNAGIALAGPLALQPISEIRAVVEVNLIGPLICSQAFLPLLGMDPALAGPPGRIVNISSVGGRLAAPFLGAYVATKHAMEGFSATLRRELMIYGVDVVIIGPGSVNTPIWDKAEAQATDPYASTDYAEPLRRFREIALKSGRKGFPPSRVADTVLTALTDAHPKTRYPVVPDKLINWTIPMALPDRVIDWIMANQLKIKRKKA